MNYMIKRVLLCAGLIIIYWGMWFRYQEVTESVLQILGSWYLGFLMFDLVCLLVSRPTEAKQ